MRVFVLTTGRSGSLTFVRACSHATNFSAGHETRSGMSGTLARFDYPDHHIEADRHLGWFVGSLDARFGDRAHYVHLVRDEERTAASWARRMPDNESWPRWLRVQAGLTMKRRFRQTLAVSLAHQFFGGASRLSEGEQLAAAITYVRTLNANIELFLRDKTHVVRIDIDDPKEQFTRFWSDIRAEGDRAAALAEFDVRHNASSPAPRPLRTT